MRLLCFEDDAIDQKIIARIAQRTEHVEIVFASGLNEKSKQKIDAADALVLDQYLAGGSAKDFETLNLNKPVAVLSASNTLQSNLNCVGIWQKPLTIDKWIHMLCVLESEMELRLDYFNDLVGDDQSLKTELLQKVTKSLVSYQEKEKERLQEVDLQSELHKLKSRLGLFDKQCLWQFVDTIEQKLSKGAQKGAFGTELALISKMLSKLIEQLKPL